MVCRNCGAEIKPGVMYCLECGSYVEEGDISTEDTLDEETNEVVVKKEGVKTKKSKTSKKKTKYKFKLTLKDWLIYGGLLLILIGSIVVIIVTLINGTKTEEIIQPAIPDIPEVVKQDQNYTIENYSLTVTKEYSSDVQNSLLYVTDDNNFSLNFQVTSDDFDAYLEDIKKLEEELEKNHYEVLDSFEKDYNSRKFIICKIKVNGGINYLYISKIDKKYSAMGIIEEMNNNSWETALPALDSIISSVVIKDEEIDDSEETTKEDNSQVN